MVPAKKFPWWFFNSYMLWGAVLGWVIAGAAEGILETAAHDGVGVIVNDEGVERALPEAKYKRERYVQYGMLLGVGLLIWGSVAGQDRK